MRCFSCDDRFRCRRVDAVHPEGIGTQSARASSTPLLPYFQNKLICYVPENEGFYHWRALWELKIEFLIGWSLENSQLLAKSTFTFCVCCCPKVITLGIRGKPTKHICFCLISFTTEISHISRRTRLETQHVANSRRLDVRCATRRIDIRDTGSSLLLFVAGRLSGREPPDAVQLDGAHDARARTREAEPPPSEAQGETQTALADRGEQRRMLGL